jgi:hypothetical protein
MSIVAAGPGPIRAATRSASKARIVGERELLRPVLVNEAPAANDRAKYLITLL